MYTEYIKIFSHTDIEMIDITTEVERIVKRSNCTQGIVLIISLHTTTGITINESLPDVEQDILNQLSELIQDDSRYLHARFLPSYGATSNNAAAHIKSCLLGNHAMLSILNGELEKGDAQNIYLAEFDGPQSRKIIVKIMGE